jgi:hypothetical protein
VEDPAVSPLREARQALDEVIAEIQRVPGFEDFLAAPSFDDVAAAAMTEGQPLAYLAAAEHGGLALVVRGADVAHVDLPDLGRAPLEALVRDYLEGYAEFRDAPGRYRTAWDARLAEVTAWLWPTLMEPLLAELGDAAAATLIPGGLLGLLPLHAAWRPDGSRPARREHALDRLVLSYAPNARSLSAARAAANEITGRRVLAVATPTGPGGLRQLPLARQECLAACAAAGGGTLLDAGLDAGGLTVAAVSAAIRAADIAHFACHGHADLEAPLDSGLTVAPGEVLTVRDLMTQDLRLRLAVLSACETLLPGTELPDEVVSLPTGLIQAGAAGVIASLWTVPDLESAALMVDFYGRWHGDETPARALRDAQAWVRDTSPADKYAAYERAASGVAAWPPALVADALLDRIALAGTAGSADAADFGGWAAFAHVGV